MSKEYVIVPKEDYVDTCDAIREKINSTALLKSDEMAQAVRDISASAKEEQEKAITITENGTTEILPDDGKALSKVTVNVNVQASNDFYDTFWDAFQQNGERRSYAKGFAGIGWTDDSFQPKYDIKPNAWAADGLFSQSRITDLSQILQDCNVVLDTSECVSLIQMFSDVSLMVRVPPISLVSATMEASTSTMFYSAPKLETIDKIISSPQTVFYGNMFTTPSLKNVTFEGEIGNSISFPSCSKLTVESAKSILTHLVNYAGTEKEFVNSVLFADSVWELLNTEGATAPGDITWEEYVNSIGWNK